MNGRGSLYIEEVNTLSDFLGLTDAEKNRNFFKLKLTNTQKGQVMNEIALSNCPNPSMSSLC